VAIFAKACFGHPSPSKRQKLNATADAFGAPIRPRHHVPTQQGVGTLAPNDLTPCRMAFYFVSTFAIAQTPTKQPALRLSRTKNLHFAKAPFPGFSAEALIRESDTAARIRSDEFALILLDSGNHSAKVVAKKILNSLLSPFMINNQQFSIGSSIGIAIYPQDGSDSDTLLQQADRAMYFAKNNNKAYAFCTPELDEEGKRRLEIEQGLRKALIENNKTGPVELTLVYQSKYYLHDNSIQGYEVLIRWQHPELGIISPSEFIPLAEQTGLIVDLSRWVITQASLQALQWEKDGIKFKNLAIKISAIELINFELAQNIISQIDATGAQREWIEIEMTESAVMKMPDVSIKFIEDLVNAGVLVIIDSFGTGHSSISYLKTLPASYLKTEVSQ
ncbi:hypothetical protein BMR07_11565, partial [Methylococcaceae bacterium CS1]